MRFSLLTLMLIVFGAALICGLFLAVPPRVSVYGLTLIGHVLPAMQVAGVVYTRGNFQAFCIGSLVGSTFIITMIDIIFAVHLVERSRFVLEGLIEDDVVGSYQTVFAIAWGTSLLAGLAAMGVRGLAIRCQRPTTIDAKGTIS